jgi:two-component system chemotaxis response regulator CheY
LGFETEEADGREKALKVSNIRMLDIGIVDRDVPMMNGLSFAKELCKTAAGRKTVTIFCDTGCEPKSIRAALDTGADECIMKLFNSEIIRSKFLLLIILD